MTPTLPTRSVASGRRASPWTALLTAVLLIAFAMSTGAQAPVATSGAVPPPATDDLEKLVGRIALYPDDLVSIILPASTNPLQIVQADRFLEKRKADPKLPIDDKWDDAVKTLLNYPDIVKMMSADLDWTSDLGEAVVADQADVLEAVQSFRRKAQAAGNLKSDTKQVVKTEKEIIIIEPADPQVIYVPQYNPTTVVVYSAAPYYYGYYPTPYPSYYYPYPPGAAFAAGVIWGAAIGAIWSGGRYGANYGGGSININRNTNINTGNINTGNIGGGASQRPAGGGSEWKSSKSPGQVSNSVGKNAPSTRAGDAGAGAAGGGARASTGATGGGARPSTGATGAGARPSTGATGAGARPSTGAAGAGASASANRSGSSGGSAFSSSGSSGRQTSANSSRGASSSRSMSSGGGGGARGGGGGGGGRRR